ncbi:LysM repeat protein [Arthrobacter pigmenti]|uniref:LysM repeat protein n=1 Tax=Arthrobacter pigmenti TaxID=271432 RepID=A0A846RNQ0_9MICC|nr:LysM peptidoglycan-binding domain-containing protein [Arthrobacter pigmenti]NJC21974.1 LysM repeat protein [Arthrobacter pigmenti]
MSTLQLAGPGSAGHTMERSDAGVPRVHLTRRGWLVLVAVPLALVAAAAMILAASLTSQAKAAGSAGGVTETVQVDVAVGQTLWGLAAEYAPDRDPREVVAEIAELNALTTSTVQAGQALHIPVSTP